MFQTIQAAVKWFPTSVMMVIDDLKVLLYCPPLLFEHICPLIECVFCCLCLGNKLAQLENPHYAEAMR
jgi:hypothetical protein